MDIDLLQVENALQELGGIASCLEMANLLRQQYTATQYSEVDLAVRCIVYSHCPQHPQEYRGKPIFEAVDAWNYRFWKPAKQYSDRYVQALYRKKLVASWGCCMVTGAKVQCKASHIKPRHQCKDQTEKANVFNGLLLNPILDVLFDKGLISFDDHGQILFSSKLDADEIQRLGLSPTLKVQTIRNGHRAYLQYHRTQVFLGVSGSAEPTSVKNALI
ncbi:MULTISPECIES: HNH endonuclease [Trichocoleus]|uniref:HNH endonuclease n=1 Tax=Trichocoleus desertorum GB2-A4 TaxID=2933944 RepID=A0ABV0JFL5_9CYAN|nr:HNH endonuclease [Trichocoleus sp. FACHB-46]MBD1862340.1 HNH endonuclease [Trichocoleus sp. FACHB-46]